MAKQGGSLNNSTYQIDALTGARFPAIMVIVFGHMEFLKAFSYGDAVSLFMNAQPGVDFFFVMSGFGMMLHSIRRDPGGTDASGGLRGALDFGIRHVRKIYPVYVVMMAVSIPYFTYNASLYMHSAVSALLLQLGKFVFNLTLLQSMTGMQMFSHGLNGVSWFLSTLFCIYLVSPVLMGMFKLRLKTLHQAVAAWIAVVLVGTLLAYVFTGVEERTIFDDLTYGSPYRRVWYVAAGMLTAQIFCFRQKQDRKTFFDTGFPEYLAVGICMIWFFARRFARIGSWVYAADLMSVSFCLYTLASGKGKISAFLAGRRMVRLGQLSMYVFLIHYPIRLYLDLLVVRCGLSGPVMGVAEVAVILVLTYAASLAADRGAAGRRSLRG